MAVKIHSVTSQRALVKMPVGDESLSITYNPAGLTPEKESELRDENGENGSVSAMYARTLASIILDWDLLEEDGEPVKINPERFMGLPSRFLSQVVDAISEDMSPKRKPSRNSGSFS